MGLYNIHPMGNLFSALTKRGEYDKIREKSWTNPLHFGENNETATGCYLSFRTRASAR
jgi:hypothetical protein